MMWKNWVRLAHMKNVMAADISSALFLAGFLKNLTQSRRYADYMEVADLQRYKMIRKPQKVRIALKEKAGEPFVFHLYKN